MKLSGLVVVRNAISLDYCFRESISSLLPIVDTMIVCDGESTDGTQEEIREWMLREPKIKLCVYPWKSPVADIHFFVDWLNFARQHCDGEYIIQLDADEVMGETSYPIIQRYKTKPEIPHFSLWCARYNFWRDQKHLIPWGVCCSHRVVRFLPQQIWLPSDGPDPRGAHAIKMAQESGVEIFHYGFLRKRKQLFEKSRQLQNMFFGTYDGRLSKVEAKEGNWMEQIEDVEWINNLLPYDGTHPKLIHEWLIERGYAI